MQTKTMLFFHKFKTETGAVFTFGKSHFADNEPSHFFIKNDPVIDIACGDDHTAVICGNINLSNDFQTEFIF